MGESLSVETVPGRGDGTFEIEQAAPTTCRGLGNNEPIFSVTRRGRTRHCQSFCARRSRIARASAITTSSKASDRQKISGTLTGIGTPKG